MLKNEFNEIKTSIWEAFELADYRKAQIHGEFFLGVLGQGKHRNTAQMEYRVYMELNIHIIFFLNGRPDFFNVLKFLSNLYKQNYNIEMTSCNISFDLVHGPANEKLL